MIQAPANSTYIFLAQLILGLILHFVFRHFTILFRRRFLRSWSFSWLAFTIYMGSMLVMDLAGSSVRYLPMTFNLIAQLMCFLQVVMILRGIHEMVSERTLNRKRFQKVLMVFVAIAVVTVVAYNEKPDDATQRNLLRFGSRTASTGLGFLITSLVVWFHPKFTRGFGRPLLASTSFLYSAYQLYFFMVILFGAIHIEVATPVFYGIADVLLIGLMGMSMVMWLLEDERMKLEKANLELDRFLYSTSHDLRAPMASIMGLTYLGKLEFKEEKALLFMEMIEERIRKLDAVIVDILNLSRTKKFEVRNEKIQLQRILDEVVSDIRFNKNASAITLDYNPDPDHVFTSDYSQMKVILSNLLSNAVKYHRLDQEKPFIRVAFARFSDYVEITVEDNGIGIPAERLPKIFEMFYRASESTEGTGLGLYIVQEALNRVKGSITVESVEGKGSKFVVQLEDA